MIFTEEHCEKILRGEKTQTRRLVKPGEFMNGTIFHQLVQRAPSRPGGIGHVKWSVGRTYSIQPGRTKPGVARIRLTAIRRERVQEIPLDDLLAEGMEISGSEYDDPCDIWDEFIDAEQDYARLWDRLNPRKGTRWADNPLVWVLTFELVKDGM